MNIVYEEIDLRINDTVRPANFSMDDAKGKIRYLMATEFQSKNTDWSTVKIEIREHTIGG